MTSILAFEGGLVPEDVTALARPATPDMAPIAALIPGCLAANVGLPPIPKSSFVRRFQREQLGVALPWVCR